MDAGDASASLGDVARAIQVCRRCPLWRDTTQGVAGEGAAHAGLMLVGEQPGDQEDRAGRPFVGPAGQMLDRALADAGVPRAEVYITNAVKHFKSELRGKRRLHKTPQSAEIAACRWWLDQERRLVAPRVVVALGATAASSVMGRAVPVMKSRGQAFRLDDGARCVVTVHPSYVLRIPDQAARAQAYDLFVKDLTFARGLNG
jgi:DNA polymerase